MKIEETITEPLQRYIEGTGLLMRFPITQSARGLVSGGKEDDLHRQMEPFYSMWLEDSPRLDWMARSVISDIAHIDPLFGGWASRQDLMKMARAWSVRGNGEEMIMLMDCMIHCNNYEPYCGDNAYEEVTEELRYQRVDGNIGSGEIYALLHSFITIVMSPPRFGRHKELFQLLKTHWDFLRHVYCVMTGSIIGLGFANFVSLANNLKNAKYHPYLHLVYWFLSDNADTLCSKKQQKGMVKALTSLEDIMYRTEPNPELDELCQMLFPEEVREMLIKHPKTPYRQLETEVKELRKEKSELKKKLNTLAQKQEEITRQMASELQKAFVEDSIPYAEIEEELLELPPKTVGGVFSALNDMLGGNDVWHKHYKSLRAKVRKREKEKETPTVDARQIFQIGDSPQYDENKE